MGNKPKIYVDGKDGTTGLQIYEHLGARDDIELLLIADEVRKDTAERRRLINAADIVFLCLPDDAAREAVTLVENDTTRIIDASTAHRTSPAWDYGFPELSAERRRAIAKSKRVANPGCHATGFVASVYPLVQLGILPADYPLTCFSLTGYSGGGKKMIADYEGENASSFATPGIYGVTQNHKHLPEMTAIPSLVREPVFCPIVDDYYAGMATTITLHSDLLAKPMSAESIRAALADYYGDARFVKVAAELACATMYTNFGVGTNDLLITVGGNEHRVTITSQFDNLGKGASGAAVQNMNIMLGVSEDTGL